uniref:protein MODIFIER OF SNC1 1 isoform X2 n=1 Tax=Erigeron canadensis TaxID=72917 RepID=UPI001CB9CA48|nr:protein MODIFIER OF SNC1 1 isoform X2 [Erigeron canadensis]
MTSSMLAGERRWASARRGGMTVLGKVAVPKPINLPSQKLENHGLDPNVEIVPKGSLSWGSRPSSSTSNPWGSSAVSPNADGSSVSPSGRPSSGGGLSRPSTAGSDRHEPSTTTWGPNSRPSSASAVLTSNQSSLTSSRPLSAETRPGSAHLSRFAEPAYDTPAAWGPNGTADKLSVPSKANDFSLSSGDFPTLGSEKDNSGKSSEQHGAGRTAPAADRNAMAPADHKSGTVDTWTRDSSHHFEDGVRPSADNWQHGDPQQYINPNIPPQHFDAWRGPPMNAPPASVWYRGPPPAGPPYPPVPRGGYPMESYHYYRPQISPNLANSQSGPPPGPVPRGHHPRNGDFYRPQMHEPFIRPGMPIRPGFYPGPVPYDGYYGPPMNYNPNDRDMQFMGMPPGPPGPPGPHGPHGPPVYNMGPAQNPPELHDLHFRSGGRGSVGNMFASEKLDSIPPEESRGPYKVLRKHEIGRDADLEGESWEQNLEKSDQTRPSLHKNERGTDIRKNEDMPSRRNLGHQGNLSDTPNLHSLEGSHKSKASNESWGNKLSFPEAPNDVPINQRDSSLIQKIEGLNAKVRASDSKVDAEQNNRQLVSPNDHPMIAFGTISDTGDLKSTTATVSSYSRHLHHGVRSRAEQHNKGRINNQDTDGWRKRPQILGSEVATSVSAEAVDNPEAMNTDESLAALADPADGQAQRARMRELAKQRTIQLQQEEEERIKEQKAKALAKLEELNRRTLAAGDGSIQNAEKILTSAPGQKDVDGFQKSTGPVIDYSKLEPPNPVLDVKAQAAAQISETSQQEPVDQSSLSNQSVANANDAESKGALHGNDGNFHRQKRASHRQKLSVQSVDSLADKSTSGTGEAHIGPGGEATKDHASHAVSGEPGPHQDYNSISVESTQQRKRNSKSSKNKHKLDDASASREGGIATESGKPESQNDFNSSTMLVTDGKNYMQSNMEESHDRVTNQYKPQHPRRMPRNPQANRTTERFHVGDVAVWAPVRAPKEERGDDYSQKELQDEASLPAKSINSGQTNLKSKRAEMERYVPKPVAKELAHHGSINQSALPSSPGKTTLEDMPDKEDLGSQPEIPVSVSVGTTVESKSGDNKQNKQAKPHGWKQRGPTDVHRDHGFQQDSKKNDHKSKTHEVPIPVSTETNVSHEWDPSDGWFMPDEYPPNEAIPVASSVKDEGGVTGKGKRPAYKGQKSTMKSHNVDHKDVGGAEVEIEQTDRPASSKENRSSHWQPKPQAYKSGWSSGVHNARPEIKKVRPDEPAADFKDGRGAPHEGHHKYRRERQPALFRQQPHSLIEDEIPIEQQHGTTGFRKFGGQNNRSGCQDDRRKHNQHNASINRERQKQNLHYEYQPVGSNINSSNKSNILDAPADGSGNAVPRYKERVSGAGQQSRRGGGNFYGRQ